MSKYLRTDQGIMLENILRENFSYTGLSKDHIGKAIHHKHASKDEVRSVIKWCQKTVEDYISVNGALCKGELKYAGSRFLEIQPWQFDNQVLEKKFNDEDSIKVILKEALLKENIIYEKLSSLIRGIGRPCIIAYDDVTSIGHIVWYTDIDRAEAYVKNFLTTGIDVKKQSDTKSSMKEKPKHEHEHPKKDTYFLTKKIDEPVKKEHDKMTIDEFVKKYRLNDSAFVDQSPITNLNIDKVLYDAGLKDVSDRAAIMRRMVRSPRFADILKINRDEDYSREKLIEVVRIYSNDRYKRCKEFLEYIDTVFEIHF